MLADLLLHMLAAAPKMATDVTAAIGKITSDTTNIDKARDAAVAAASIAEELSAAVAAAEKAAGGTNG